MKKMYALIIFGIATILQLAVPVKMIFDNEDVLTTGTMYKFKTRPVDPNDPFRGKYITLNYAIESFKSKDTTWQRGNTIYVYLQKDLDGFAKVESVSKVSENTDLDYVTAKVNWYNKRDKTVNFDFKFNRYYMDEFKAKPAEDLYRANNRRNDSLYTTYALVAIKNGDAVLKDVMINEKSIKDYIEK